MLQRKGVLPVFAGVMFLGAWGFPAPAAESPRKEASVFYPTKLIETVRHHIARYAWARAIQEQALEAAQPWMEKSDEELWDLMFGPTIKRAWHVWSNGFCPACKNGVPMYNWQIDALKRPWKVRCPHCQELFPKNDFAAFYRSGLDEHGIFDPARADRSLLFNAEHPDPQDPLHLFGVDDGEGYVEGDHRWRFIGAYLIYGQWKQAVVGGIQALATAYVLTGDRAYAHKAGVLLDRVADLYPSFDFRTQGVMYEGPAHAGYVSTWHDACEETRELALAYDQVFEALREDAELVAFLSRQAAKYGLNSPKNSWADVQRNIEQGLLQDPIDNAGKIVSNYPRQVLALLTLRAVLDEAGYREEIEKMMDEMLQRATAVDGVTGEKGLAGYSAYVIQGLAQFLAAWDRARPGFLAEMLRRYPQLHQTYRFHIDTWALQQYYPLSGDTGSFARKIDQYVGVAFQRSSPLAPSMFTFLWRLYELTGDAAFVQALYRANGKSVEGLPHDLFVEDPETVQRGVAEVIAREGPVPRLGSVNKTQWHLALLRSGEGERARVVWLDYDAGGGHGHADGMNLGLFAYGLDLLPDFGYPPVQYGGWSGPRFSWYVITPSHNTVVVDGQSQPAAAGKATLWADGQRFHAVRASGPELIGGPQFERTVALVDLSDREFYVLDLFRVVGGKDHAKFLHSYFGQITPTGLSLQPAEEYGYGAQMRNFQGDRQASPGWSVDWKIEDRYGYLPPGSDIHLRYTDLTTEAEAYIAEAWIAPGGPTGTEEAWIPRLMVRRRAEAAPLASTFVGVIEPYDSISSLGPVRRLPLETPEGTAYPDPNVAVEVQLRDGRRDLFISADVENPLGLTPAGTLVQKEWGVQLEGEACFVRKDAAGQVERMALCRGSRLRAGTVEVILEADTDFIEIAFGPGQPTVVAGDPGKIRSLRQDLPTPPTPHRAEWMHQGRFGIMVHWLISPPGNTEEEKTAAFNRTVEDFDLDTFIQQFESTGADWLIFTLGQNTGYYCSPNAFLDRVLPGHTSRRDLALEIAQRVKALGKRFIAYLPSEVYGQSEAVQQAFGWNPTDQSTFQQRYQQFVRDYAVKFGSLLDGWWFDGCYDWEVFPNRLYDWANWLAAARAGNPEAIVAFNDGAFCINKVKPVTPLEDYHAGEVHMLKDGKIKLGHEEDSPLYMPDSRFIEGVQWHALLPVDSTFEGGAPYHYSDEVLFQWVRECKAVGGAVTLNLPIALNGTIPAESLAQMQRLGKALGHSPPQ